MSDRIDRRAVVEMLRQKAESCYRSTDESLWRDGGAYDRAALLVETFNEQSLPPPRPVIKVYR